MAGAYAQRPYAVEVSEQPQSASWAPDSWRSRAAAQQPVWPDEGELKRVYEA